MRDYFNYIDMRTYRRLKRNKMFPVLREIGERLEERDFKENNFNYKGMQYRKIENGFILETEFIKKTYWYDIFYLFDLFDWVKQKKYYL